MRRMMFGLVVAVSGCGLTARVGDGDLATEVRSPGAFERLDARGQLPVRVLSGAAPAVTVVCDRNLLPLIRTEVHDGALELRQEDERGRSIGLDPQADCRVEVVATSLVAARVSGSGEVEIAGAALTALASLDVSGSGSVHVAPTQAVDALTVGVSGSGSVIVDQVRAGAVRAEVTGSGRCAVSGAAASATVELSGSGGAELRGLVVEAVEASVSGSGHAQVTATASLNAEISGSGRVEVWGAPAERTQQVSGSGEVVWRE